MLIYLDESYNNEGYIFIGSLFLPIKSSRNKMHKEFSDIKQNYNYLDIKGHEKEIKYSLITSQKRLDLAKEAVKLFLKHTSAYFRAGALPFKKELLDKIGIQKGIPNKLKEAMLYTRCTVQLFKNNLGEVKNATLLMDNLTRPHKDRFDEIIRMRFGEGENPIFKHISYIDSSQPTNHVIQICDLLLGAIYNENYPCNNNLFKNEFREFVKKELGISSLLPKYWKGMTAKQANSKHSKFSVRFWKFPY